ncbi:MAG: hypothetical protein HY332_16770 [Chloroflexi bacterium]|nr:hypothetical protein [Chloroflexota bacterium]
MAQADTNKRWLLALIVAVALAVGLLAPPADARPAALTMTPSAGPDSSLRPGAVVRL